ncbi:MAG: methyltransferase domain-containing protein [Phycisphaerales bacterium]|nr:methyltransferase domain-containing protein [Phycisphaerales bacterium]
MSAAGPYVSRAGRKLEHALQTFDIDVAGRTAADFGCNVGGFTDCLLQRGATRVMAVDTGYGTLAWKLRQDDRVVVMERTNALHAEPPPEGVDLVVVDLGWTPQRRALPAARRWLAPGGRIISLVKPHYELDETERRAHLREGRLDPEIAEAMLDRVWAAIPDFDLAPLGRTRSPLVGGKSGRRGAGNVEYLILVGM